MSLETTAIKSPTPSNYGARPSSNDYYYSGGGQQDYAPTVVPKIPMQERPIPVYYQEAPQKPARQYKGPCGERMEHSSGSGRTSCPPGTQYQQYNGQSATMDTTFHLDECCINSGYRCISPSVEILKKTQTTSGEWHLKAVKPAIMENKKVHTLGPQN